MASYLATPIVNQLGGDMASKSRHLRAAMTSTFTPAVTAQGWHVEYPHFRRHVGDEVQLGEIQPHKDVAAIILEFGRHTGPFQDWAGKLIAPDALTVTDLPIFERARLCHTNPMYRPRLPIFEFDDIDMANDRVEGFSYQDIHDDQPALDAMVAEILTYLPQIEAWFADPYQIGPNILAAPPS